jgi:hypothetical protein
MGTDLELDILRYLLDHPAAKDTVDGIRVWWLPADTQASAGEVAATVARLVQRGWLVTGGDQRAPVFGVAAEAMSEIARQLQESRRG